MYKIALITFFLLCKNNKLKKKLNLLKILLEGVVKHFHTHAFHEIQILRMIQDTKTLINKINQNLIKKIH